ncbi:MAG: hypothetical protein QOJ76_3187 [Acidobacteriota bacterium]|nr:hypothetical protein [Acidobacteriota bacterium]
MLPHSGRRHASAHLKLTGLVLLSFIFHMPLYVAARAARKPPLRGAPLRARLFSEAMAKAQEDGEGTTTIELAKPFERELKGGQSHAYRLALETGQYMRLVVNQKGIDVVVTLFGPDGRKVSEVDSPNGSEGPEPLSLITAATGQYRLEVSSTGKDAAQGRYEVNLEILRPATAQDRSRVGAENLYAEGLELLTRNNAETRRAAVEKLEQAAPLFHEAGLPAKEAEVFNLLAQIYSDAGDKRKALGYVERALPLVREAGDRLEEAHTLYNLAEVEAYIGETFKGLEHLNQALQLVRAVGNPDKEASVMLALARFYGLLGDWQKQLDYENRALELSRASKNLLKESMMLSQLGLYYHQAGDLERSLYYHTQAVSIVKAAVAAGRFTVEPSWYKPDFINLGFLYSDMGRQEQALDYFQRALALSREEGDKIAEALTLCDIGRSYTRMGNRQKAIEINQQALAIAQTLGDVYLQSFALENLGDVYLELGETQKALDLLKRALVVGHNQWGDFADLPIIAGIARAESRLGNLAEALEHMKTAISMIERQRMSLKRLDIRTTLLASTSDYYEFYIELLMELHKQHPGASYDAQALQASERARARVLVELLTESGANIRRGIDPALFERERRARQALNAKAAAQMQLRDSGSASEQSAQIVSERESLAREIEDLNTQLQQIETEIRIKNPRYAALTTPEPLELRQIQDGLLDPETIVLEYSLGVEHSYLWCITQTSLTAYELPAKAKIDAAARTVYELLTARNGHAHERETGDEKRARVERADAEYPRAAAALSDMLLGAVAPLLGRKRLLVIADGVLQYVPFAALPVPAGTSRAGGDGSRRPPLIVEHEIVSLPSVSTLAALRRDFAGRRPAPKGVAILADPVFDKDDQRVRPHRESVRTEAPNAGDGGFKDKSEVERALEDVTDEEGGVRLQRLWGTRLEAQAIDKIALAHTALMALDFAANRETAISAALSQFRIVHFATHAFIDNVHPELSGIVLSLVDQDGRPQDGFLRANEVFNLKLPAELVVLSACRTGLGKEVRGEGLIGLTRGFMYAGTPRVVVSSWSINDKATAELMSAFYRKMLGAERLSPAAALRAAQIEMWSNSRRQAPYFWATFTLQGEWK